MYSEHRCMGHPGTLDGNSGHAFAMFTSLVSGKDYTTISAVLPAIMDLNLHL